MAALTHEHFRVLYFDGKAREVIGERVWAGTMREVEVPFPEIFRSAIKLDAGSMVIAHNHPSGDPQPSRQDVELTRRFNSICKHLEIRLLDHLIIARDRSFSFLGHGLM